LIPQFNPEVQSRSSVLLAEPLAPAWGEGVVQLDEHDQSDAQVVADYAECGAYGVEALGDEDAAADGALDFGWGVFFDEAVTAYVGPAPVEDDAREEDVDPVGDEG
jgi:hypothetical protein